MIYVISTRNRLSPAHTAAPMQFVDDDGVAYSSILQYVSYHKALLFHDVAVADKILRTHEPHEQRAMVSTLIGYNTRLWKASLPSLLFKACVYRFGSDSELLHDTIGLTKDCTSIIYADPDDIELGIGISETALEDGELWQGMGIYGIILPAVLKYLRLYACRL